MGAWEEGRTRWYKIISWLVSCLAGQVTFSPFFTAFDSLPCWLSTLSVLYSVLCTYTKYSVQEILLFYYSILFYYFINIFYCIFFSEISSILMLIVQEWYAGGFPRIVGGGTKSPTWHDFSGSIHVPFLSGDGLGFCTSPPFSILCVQYTPEYTLSRVL